MWHYGRAQFNVLVVLSSSQEEKIMKKWLTECTGMFTCFIPRFFHVIAACKRITNVSSNK